MKAGQMTERRQNNRLFVGQYDCHQQNRLAELFFGNFQARLPEQNCRESPTAARGLPAQARTQKPSLHPTHPQLGRASPSPLKAAPAPIA